jgi:hypothetical protein
MLQSRATYFKEFGTLSVNLNKNKTRFRFLHQNNMSDFQKIPSL